MEVLAEVAMDGALAVETAADLAEEPADEVLVVGMVMDSRTEGSEGKPVMDSVVEMEEASVAADSEIEVEEALVVEMVED